MTPRSFDSAVVQTRLNALSTPLRFLAQIVPVTPATLSSDITLRLALERALTQLVEVSSDTGAHILSTIFDTAVTSYAESFAQLAERGVISQSLATRLQNAAKMRNVLVRMYLDVDYGMVAQAAPVALEDFTEFRRAVSTWLNELDCNE